MLKNFKNNIKVLKFNIIGYKKERGLKKRTSLTTNQNRTNGKIFCLKQR